MTKENKTYCLFSAQYLPYLGGVESYTQNLAKTLIEKGNKVIVVTSNTHQLEPIEEESDLTIVRLPCHNLFEGRLPLPRKNAAYKRLLRYLDTRQIDHIIVNTRFYPHSLLGVKMACRRGVRPIVIDHGSAYIAFGNPLIDVFVVLWEHWFTARMKKYPLDFYAVSSKGINWLKTFGITGLGVLNNSIDASAFLAQSSARSIRDEHQIPQDAFVVAFIGRLISVKGIKQLLQAAKQLESFTDIRFLFAGEGPYAPAIEQGGDNVILIGKLNTADVAAFLKESDVLCLPSRSEGFSTTLLEAAACALPIISTEVGGAKEIMPNESFGTIIPDATPQAIKKALLSMYNNKAKAKAQGLKAQARVQQEFSWNKTTQKVIEACQSTQQV